MKTSFSDLISENLTKYLSENSQMLDDGESVFEYGKHDVMVERYKIEHDTTAKALMLSKGKYSLVTLPNVHEVTDKVFDYYAKFFKTELSQFVSNPTNVLVVGLGNRHISADSLGAKVVGKITITNHIPNANIKVSAIAPSVLGLTGLESSDIVQAVSNKLKPDLLIVIDSLCASDVSRLGCSFQINNCPITPGSGVNNARKVVGKGVNVVSIGVPLVVYGSTFVSSALSSVGITKNGLKSLKTSCLHNSNLSAETKDVIVNISKLHSQNFDGIIVASKDVESVVEKCSTIIAKAIDYVLLGL